MIPTELPPDEPERQAALERYGVLDGQPDALFDNITRMVGLALDVPIALVSLLDNDRQWFLSRYGLSVTQTPRVWSFCGHVVASRRPLEVPDAPNDVRFADNPLVVMAPKIRFYAGSPLRSGGGGVWQGVNNCTGAGYGPGGDGAGIVYVTAGTLTATGGAAFTASGGSSNHCAQGSWTYGAGGGAGGTLWLAADTLSLASGAVDAQGGLGNSSNIRLGGNGGSGRVRLDCATCNGYTNGSAGAATALSDAATPDPAISMVP